MRIGLDFDGVVTDCGKLKSDAAWKLHGLEIPPDKFKKELVIGKGLLTAEQYFALQKTIYDTRDVGLLMEPVPGALEYIPRLRACGHDVTVITSRYEESLDVAREWSQLKALNLDFTGVGYGVSKASACAKLDAYIDDDLDKLEPLVGIVPHCFLFSWGYNRHIDARTVAKRVSSWEAFFQAITSLEGVR